MVFASSFNDVSNAVNTTSDATSVASHRNSRAARAFNQYDERSSSTSSYHARFAIANVELYIIDTRETMGVNLFGARTVDMALRATERDTWGYCRVSFFPRRCAGVLTSNLRCDLEIKFDFVLTKHSRVLCCILDYEPSSHRAGSHNGRDPAHALIRND